MELVFFFFLHFSPATHSQTAEPEKKMGQTLDDATSSSKTQSTTTTQVQKTNYIVLVASCFQVWLRIPLFVIAIRTITA